MTRAALAKRGGLPVQAKVVSFTQPTSTGTQAITGAGFAPNAAIVLVNRPTADATWTDDIRVSVGFVARNAAGTTQYGCVGTGVDHNQATTNTGRNQTAAAVVNVCNGTGTALATAPVSAWGADGFTFNWTAADAVARKGEILFLKVPFAYLHEIAGPGSGSNAITGVGFAPKLTLILQGQTNAADGAATAGVSWSLGAFDGTNQGCVSWLDSDNAAATSAYTMGRTDDVVHTTGSGTGTNYTLAANSHDADGATFTSSGASTRRVWLLFLGGTGVFAAVNDTTKPTGAAPQTQNIALNSPKAGLFFSDWKALDQANSVANNRSAIGVTDGTTHAVVGWRNTHTADPSSSRSYTDEGTAFLSSPNNTDTIEALCTASVDLDSLDLTWTTNDSDADPFFYAVIGGA